MKEIDEQHTSYKLKHVTNSGHRQKHVYEAYLCDYNPFSWNQQGFDFQVSCSPTYYLNEISSQKISHISPLTTIAVVYLDSFNVTWEEV